MQLFPCSIHISQLSLCNFLFNLNPSVIKKKQNIFQEIPELEINTSLVGQVVDSGGCLLACVSGVVKASDVALRSITRPDITGVMWRHTIQEHLAQQVMGFW